MKNNEQNQNKEKLESLFKDAEIIYTYTRQDAINDGVFLDVTEQAKKVGFRVSVAITNQGIDRLIVNGNNSLEQPEPYDEALKDFLISVLFYINSEINVNPNERLFTKGSYNFYPNKEKLTKFWIAVEGDQNGNPALNIFLPEEY